MYSQPSVAFGRVFVGSDNGVVYSLDARTGCVYWAFQADMFGRFAPIAAPISGYPGTRYAIFFVTRSMALRARRCWRQSTLENAGQERTE